MILPSVLHREACTIVRVTRGLPDADGIPVEVETRHPWDGVNIQQMSTKEQIAQGRDTTATKWRVAGPPVDIEAGDRIEWAGKSYYVDGDPDTRRGLHRIEHTSLVMTRTKGSGAPAW